MNSNSKKAFSLIEMSVVLTISGFILISFLQIFPQIVIMAKNADNTKKMRNISDALNAYILENKKLPQPTNIKKSSTDSCYATSSGDCKNKADKIVNGNVYIGGIPSLDLNIGVADMFDAYGNKFVYAVNKKCTENIFNCDTESDKLISIEFLNHKTNNLAYVVISNGRDRLNAISRDGKTTKSNNNIKNTYGYYINNNDNIAHEKYNDDKIIYANANVLKSKLLLNMNCKKPNIDDILNKIAKNCNGETITENEANIIFNVSNFYYGWSTVLKTYTVDKESSTLEKACVVQCGQYGEFQVFNYITKITLNQ